jgi:glycosyltransferase involved in cell wall biosynthesis
MARICFVSHEIHPTTPGGAGSLIYHLAKTLLEEGHEIIFLLDLSLADFQRFNTKDRLNLPTPSRCRAYHVDSLCTEMPYREELFPSRYLWESIRYDHAARQVYDLDKPEVLEFVDYYGPAYFALCAKIAGLSYLNTHIVVRVHGAVESIDRRARVKPLDFDRYTIYALERYSLRLAETVLYPTASSLQEYRTPGHDPWYGETALSRPVVTTLLHREQEDPDANIVLFYGRLFSVKGPDLFVDAAILLLLENPESRLKFYLVGYDSMEPPIKEPVSYQDYLSRKIPDQYRNRFTFTGFLNKEPLEKLLPGVKLAVFPSQYESFCLAAHELHQAGIPLILSPLPAFQDHFRPGVDALFYDGSITDLVEKIQMLDKDDAVRRTLSQPSLPEAADSGHFYRKATHPSWIVPPEDGIKTGIFVCIVEDERNKHLIEKSLTSLGKLCLADMQIIVLRKCQPGVNLPSAYWIFGHWYELSTPEGKQLLPVSLRLKEALLILRAGDELAPHFILNSLQTLYRQPQISYIGSWRWVVQKKRKWLYTHPLAVMPELTPIEAVSPFNRCIMRTSSGTLLADLLSQNDDVLAEAGYLWKLDTSQTCGIQLPEPDVWQEMEAFSPTSAAAFTSLVLKDQNSSKSFHLARYLTMLVNTYPGSFLPIKDYWGRRSGNEPGKGAGAAPSIIARQTWRSRLSRKLSRGGPFSQRLLAFLRRLRSTIKSLV